jgi:hypothetical protein
MRNVQVRPIAVPAELMGELLDRFGGPADVLWPHPPWPPLHLDDGLNPGSAGGHGPMRYAVTEYHPGRRVRFALDPDLGDGYHELRVEPDAGGVTCRLVHELDARLSGRMRLLWPIAIRPLHEAILGDLLDNAERHATGAPVAGRPRSPAVRLLRHVAAPKPRRSRVAQPPTSTQQTTSAQQTTLIGAETVGRGTPDLADAWQLPIGPGMPDDPTRWATAIFADPPPAVDALLRLRNLLVPLVGIERGSRETFAPKARTDHECLISADEKHLDFRASVLLGSDDAGRRTVTLTTLAWTHNRAGRLYLLPVRLAHPIVVRAMLRRAGRRLALALTG